MGTLISFKQFSEATTKEITFTFGRFNPPTLGHLKLLDATSSIGREYRVYPSQSQDAKKNPLDLKQKVKYMKEMFPKHAKNIVLDRKIKTAFDVLRQFYKEGYTKVNFVIGSDRLKSFEVLRKYNGVETRDGYYEFPDGIHLISAGHRDPDSDDIVSAMSASRLRLAAANGDFKEFQLGMPKGFKNALNLFNDVRKGMGLKAETNFREHIELPQVSDIREKFIRGKIFNIGDNVIVKKTGNTIQINERKSNYIIGSDSNKYFIHDIVEVS